MDTIFRNYKKSKKSDPHILLVNLTNKINFKKEAINVLLYQTLGCTIHGKI